MYCNVSWGNTYSSHLQKLFTLQKRAIRLISNSHYRSPSAPLFIELGYLPIDDLVAFNSLSFMFKLHMPGPPSVFDDLFVKNSVVHSHNTRQKNLLHLPHVATNIARNSFFVSCIKEWNILPPEIKDSTTYSRFKVLSRKYLLQRYSQSVISD